MFEDNPYVKYFYIIISDIYQVIYLIFIYNENSRSNLQFRSWGH